ncbi:MAG: hypothetical protein ACREV6_14810 [Clostridium sp.]|uniref:hypothetical protein n=1 Tax=Clostridium sp. TaxID=1506 RepID=UPI003D6CB00D
MEQKTFLRKFGVPENIISNVLLINTRDTYYWSVEASDDTLTTYCARNKNDIYDGADETLSEKIITNKKLFFRNKDIDHSLVIEEYIKSFDNNQKLYVITSLKDDLCMYEKL